MSEQLVNLYNTTLAVNYVAGSGQITVSSTVGAPTQGTFTLAIVNQATGVVILLFRVTGVAGAVFTGLAEGADTNASINSLVIGSILSQAAISQIESDTIARCAVVKIAEQTLAAPAATITFAAIPNTFRNLRLVVNARSDTAAAHDDVYMQFNTDTAAHYSRQFAGGIGASNFSGSQTLVAKAAIGTIPGATASANLPGIIIINVVDYAGSFNRSAISNQGDDDGSGSLSAFIIFMDWLNTTAITQILLAPVSGGHFIAGSRFMLYGEA